MVSTVTMRGQTAIPVAIRRKYNISTQTKLEWIDDGHSISVVPVPKDSIKALRGKFKNIDLVGLLMKERAQERKRG